MNFSPGIVLLILALPLVDLFLLIIAGHYLGAIWTIVLVVFTSVLGFLLLQRVGTQGWSRVQQSIAAGHSPDYLMVERVILMLAGLLLLIPGFITDSLGLALLLPPLRRWFAGRMLQPKGVGQAQHPFSQQSGRTDEAAGRGNRTIEGEYKRED